MTARNLAAPGQRRSIRLGTGMPLLDAHADFQRARRAHIAARAVRWLPTRRTRQSHPRALSDVNALAWTAKKRSEARERLLAAASLLFYAEGINSVGIERIIKEGQVTL